MSSNERESCASPARPRLTLEARIARIRHLNDAFRTTGKGGRIILSHGVAALGADAAPLIVAKVQKYNAFTADNDPYHEHDMGSIEHQGHRMFWKIEYYDEKLEGGSPDPSRPEVTTRVLVIMLVSEY